MKRFIDSRKLKPVELKVVVAIILLMAVIPFTVSLVSNNTSFRIRASGSSFGRKFFCSNGNLCFDGRCEGDAWRDCSSCANGKARAVVEYACGKYEVSECNLEPIDCVETP